MLAGAGAAGIGIARLIRLAMVEAGIDEAAAAGAVVLVDSHGLVHELREDLDGPKRELALSIAAERATGSPRAPGQPRAGRDDRTGPATVLVGTTAVAGTFNGDVIRAMAAVDASARSSCRSPTRPRLRGDTRSTSSAGRGAARSWRPARRSTRSRWTAAAARSARPTTCSSSRGWGSGRSPPRRGPSRRACSCSRPRPWPVR